MKNEKNFIFINFNINNVFSDPLDLELRRKGKNMESVVK